MAISFGSTLDDREREITIAVDEYGGKGISGTAHHGGTGESIAFQGIMKLVFWMEQTFGRMKFPVEALEKRSFQKNRDITRKPVWDTWEGARRDGTLGTFTVRVGLRQNASWQGAFIWEDTGRLYKFSSFLELVRKLEDCLGETEKQQEDADEKCCIYRRDLRTTLAAPDRTVEVLGVIPDMPAYRLKREGGNATFLISPRFYRHNSCQGILYWQEASIQRTYRSFLELAVLMEEASIEESWKLPQEEVG